jgi:hypothetical protein
MDFSLQCARESLQSINVSLNGPMESLHGPKVRPKVKDKLYTA